MALGCGALMLATHGVDLLALGNAVKGIDPLWLAITLTTVLASLGVKVWRWGLLVRPVCPERSGMQIINALLLGQAANIVLPFRGGDLVRAMAIVPSDGRLGAVLAGIAVEKAFDLLALAIAAVIAILGYRSGAIAASCPQMLIFGIGLLGLAIAGMSALDRLWAWLRPRLERMSSSLAGSAQAWGDAFVGGVGRLRRARRLPAVAALTLLSWTVMYASNMTLLKGLDLQAPAGAAILVLVLVHLGVIPALMPGNVGPFYFFARLGLSVFSIPAAESIGFAVLLHAIITLPPLIGAGLVLLSGDKTWKHDR